MRLHKKSAGKCWPAVWFLGLLMQPFFILEFDMNEITPEVAAALLMLASISAGFLIGYCIRPDPHTTEDDREQAEYLMRHARQQVQRRIRLGRRTWRNLFGLWSN
jgi:hypothetical protein